MPASWTHLIKFVAEEDGQIHLGSIDPNRYPDVGLSTFKQEPVVAQVVTGSIFDGFVSKRLLTVKHLLPPIAQHEVPLVRCLGLNYRAHAAEAKMPVPEVPLLFIKPRTAVNGPHPAAINVPKFAQDGTFDYEAELSLIIGKDGRDIQEADALDHVLGYTAGNDISARTQQFKNGQWSFAKGLDGAAPLGPVIVSPSVLGDAGGLSIKAIYNGKVVQDSNTSEMIFDVAKTIAFLSQGTTLERGTVIMMGTGPGIGCMRDPKISLNEGDDMRVEIEKIGTLINKVHEE